VATYRPVATTVASGHGTGRDDSALIIEG